MLKEDARWKGRGETAQEEGEPGRCNPRSPGGRVCRGEGLSMMPSASGRSTQARMEKKPLVLATRRSLMTSEESLSYRSAGHSWIKEWVGVERLEILTVGYFKKFAHRISNPNNGMKGRQGWEFIFRLGRLECVLGWGAGAIEQSEFKSIGERGENWWVRFCEKWEGEGKGDGWAHHVGWQLAVYQGQAPQVQFRP